MRMKKSIRSYIHVIIQFAIIVYFVLSYNWTSKPQESFFLIPGTLLGLWAVWIMRLSVFSIFPDPKPQIKLLQQGPYKIIRHPMYSALFLVFIPMVFIQFSWIDLAILIFFIVNQILKLLFEEKLLKSEIKEYTVYQQNSWRLIPWIF